MPNRGEHWECLNCSQDFSSRQDATAHANRTGHKVVRAD